MSQKITPKNLSYNSSLPPFLAALRAQASGSTGPDPILAAQRRYGKKRSSSEEAEDGPLIVDEDGNTLDVQVDKDGTVKAAATESDSAARDGKDSATRDESKDDAKPSSAEPKAAIGARRRKSAKVVGGDDKEAVEPVSHSVSKPTVKKKAKKIKLSFDEGEG